MRRALLTLGLLMAAVPLSAQNPPMKMDHDMDMHVAGGGQFPAGWSARLDRPSGSLADVKFVTMGSGFHATMGPAAIFFNPAVSCTEKCEIEATFTQTKAPMHPEAYGIFVGGSNLAAADQSYLYFIVRGDGKFMIKHRAGAEVHTIVDWTDNDAIVKADANGKAKNKLEIEADKGKVDFEINGKSVHSVVPGTDGLNVSGLAGIRVNHNLDVHIEDFKINGKAVK